MNNLLQNSLVNCFAGNPNGLLNIFFTAGYPAVDSTSEIIDALNEAGVDLIEIGIPFSDPLADGPTIQESSAVALKNGMSLQLLFEQLSNLKSAAPILLMGYYNSVLNFGVAEFCQSCEEAGISGIILPDLPFEYYNLHFKDIFEKHGLSIVFLITPTTSDERIRQIDDQSTSFIYAVSSSSTTGKSTGIASSSSFLSRLSAMQLKTPFLVGFNIKNNEDVAYVNEYGAGAIIGSAFVKALASSSTIKNTVHQFIKTVRP